MRAIPSPTWRTVPTSARSVSTSYCSICLRRMSVISSGRIFKSTLLLLGTRVRELSAEAVEAALDARVDLERAGPQDEATDQVGIDRARGLDAAARSVFDLLDDLRSLGVGQLVGRGQLDARDPLLSRYEDVVLARDLVEHRSAALLGDETNEVLDELVRLGEHGLKGRCLLGRVELGIADHRPQLGDV